jgi:adenylyl- and sulfurtransferase ThiI
MYDVCSKEKDIEVLKELVGRIEWSDWVKRWAEVKGCKVDLEESGGGERDRLKYRVTCHRSGTKHSFSSMEAAAHFGGRINDALGWRVDLTNYHLDVVLNIIDGKFFYLCF